MPTMKVVKSASAPLEMEDNTLYAFPDLLDPTMFIFAWAGNDGGPSKRTNSMMDISELIDAKLSSVFTRVESYSLPFVGESCMVELDGIIGIHYEKTTNGGYEGYKVDLRALVDTRVIGFRRDTTFDNTSAEGVNVNNLTLVPGTPYVSDALSYGSMREYTRKIIIDIATRVSWKIEIFGFDAGQLRFTIQRFEDTPA